MRRLGLRLSLLALVAGLLPMTPMSTACEVGDFRSNTCLGGDGSNLWNTGAPWNTDAPNTGAGYPICQPSTGSCP